MIRRTFIKMIAAMAVGLVLPLKAISRVSFKDNATLSMERHFVGAEDLLELRQLCKGKAVFCRCFFDGILPEKIMASDRNAQFIFCTISRFNGVVATGESFKLSVGLDLIFDHCIFQE